MSCDTCDRLDKDQALLQAAIEERSETLRYLLPEDVRPAIE